LNEPFVSAATLTVEFTDAPENVVPKISSMSMAFGTKDVPEINAVSPARYSDLSVVSVGEMLGVVTVTVVGANGVVSETTDMSVVVVAVAVVDVSVVSVLREVSVATVLVSVVVAVVSVATVVVLESTVCARVEFIIDVCMETSGIATARRRTMANL